MSTKKEAPTSRAEQKQQTRQRILQAAGRGFRQGGFGGVGVDGLAKEAGVTSGAFYVHFDSKAAALRAAMGQGMSELQNGVRQCQETYGAAWWPVFVRFYLGAKRACSLAESCALQSLVPEIARSDAPSRTAFEAELQDLAHTIVSGPSSADAPQSLDAAWAALAILTGAVTFTRAVNNPALALSIAAAAERMLLPSHPASTPG